VSLLAATYLAPCNRPLYEFAAEACGASELINGGDWRELDSGRIDIAVAAPILTDPRFGGKPLYSSEVIVKRDSPYHSLEDLRGARWAINESSSWSGYWVTLRRIGSWDFFSEVVEAGFHERALRMVASGTIDGAAIDSHVLAVALRNAPEVAELIRVVESLGPSPSQPVVVRSGLDPAEKDRIRERLLGLHDPRMKEFLVEGFAPAPDYSAIGAVVLPATNGWR